MTKLRLPPHGKDIDWAILLKQIKKDTKCSSADLSRSLDISTSTMACYLNESKEFRATANQGIAALRLFLVMTDRDVPLVGQCFTEDGELLYPSEDKH